MICAHSTFGRRRKANHPRYSSATRMALVVTAITAALSIALTVAPMTAGSVSIASWPQFGFGPDHSNFGNGAAAISPGNVKTLDQQWAFGDGQPQSNPVVAAGKVFFTVPGKLVALAASTGVPVWTRTWSGTATPAYAGGLLFAIDRGSPDLLVALNAATGRIRWSWRGTSLSWPTVAGSNVYISSTQGQLFDFQIGSGKLAWRATPCSKNSCGACKCVPGIDSTTPAVHNGLVFVSGSDGHVYAFGARRGHFQWSAVIGAGQGTSSILAVSRGRLLVGTTNAKIVALDSQSGHREWVFTVRNQASGPTGLAAAYGRVFVTGLGVGPHGTNPRGEALNLSTGRPLWYFDTYGPDALDPTVAGGVLYASDTSGNLFAYNAWTGAPIGLIAALGTFGPTYPAIVGRWMYISNYAFSTSG